MMAQTEAGTEVVPMIVAEILKIVLPPVIEKLIKNLFPLEQHQIRKFGGRRFNFVDANQGEHSNGGQVLHKTSSEAKPAGGGGPRRHDEECHGRGRVRRPNQPGLQLRPHVQGVLWRQFLPLDRLTISLAVVRRWRDDPARADCQRITLSVNRGSARDPCPALRDDLPRSRGRTSRSGRVDAVILIQCGENRKSVCSNGT